LACSSIAQCLVAAINRARSLLNHNHSRHADVHVTVVETYVSLCAAINLLLLQRGSNAAA
jgi:hypothetical protein